MRTPYYGSIPKPLDSSFSNLTFLCPVDFMVVNHWCKHRRGSHYICIKVSHVVNIENGQSAQGLQNVSECSTAVMLSVDFNTQKYNVCILIENIIYYRPPTKFLEGNVFSCICPSFCPWGGGPMWLITMMHWTSLHWAPHSPHPNMKPHWTGTLSALPPGHGTSLDQDPWPHSPAKDIWWPSLETCSNLFTSGPPGAGIW